MRQYILTAVEREIAETYLRKNIKLQDFRLLVFRIKKTREQLKNDMALVDAFLEKSKSQ